MVEMNVRETPSLLFFEQQVQYAAILSAALMLDFLGEPDAAARVRAACDDPGTGSTTDIVMRVVAEHLRTKLGQPGKSSWKAESAPLLFGFPDGPACLPLLRDRRWGRWRY